MFRKTALAKSLVIAFGSTALAYGTAALAQDTTPPPAPSSAQQLQRVEITGSSIKRIDAETALPVQVLTRQDIQRTGAVNVEQLLQTITATSSSGGLTASSSAGATTGGISAFSIHGLGSLRTLILINGRRVAPYGVGFTQDSVSVDVNSIPLAAIDRIEVLEDGASAVYGSDAIGGVVNFILRKDFKGVELEAGYGKSAHGGADVKSASITFGKGDLANDKYNIMAVASVQKEGFLFGSQRNFANSSISTDHLNDVTSGNTFPANIAAADGSFGSRNPTNPACPGPYAVLDPLLSPKACRFDPSPYVTLVPGAERFGLFLSGHMILPNEMELYAEASYNQNNQHTIIQPVPLSDQFAIPNSNPLFGVSPYNGVATILLKNTSPFYPTSYVTGITGGATPDLLVRFRDSLSGNRDFNDISKAPRFVLGLKGSNAGWDWDSNFLYTSSEVTEQINNGYPQYTKILPLLNSGNVNFFGPNSQSIIDQIQSDGFTGDAFKVKTSITSLSAKASRDVYQLPAGAVSVAFGAEVRREGYNYQPSSALQVGDVSGYGGNFLPVDKNRTVSAAFGEMLVPIVKHLEADLAVRVDQYQGVGRAWTPKVGLKYQPVDAVLFRGSIGKGFRAPSLADLYSANTQSVTTTGLSDPLRCPTTADAIKDCNTQFTTTFGGNAALKPEKSVNGTLGMVLQPTANLSMSIDYFKVLLRDTIANGVDAATILADPVKYAPYIVRGPVDPNFPTVPGAITTLLQTNVNLGSTKLSGLELAANYKIPTDYGKFTIDMHGTYFIQYDAQNPDGSYTGEVDQTNTSTGGLIPRWKHYLSVDWNRGPWDVSVAQTFQKHYHDTPGNVDPNGTPRDVASYLTYDTQASYAGFKGWKVTLGIRNVFDRIPPYVNTNAAFQTGYDPQYADPRGRFFYGKVSYAFN